MAGCNSNKNSPADKTEGKTKKEIDLSSLRSGIYFLRLEAEGRCEVKKVVKE